MFGNQTFTRALKLKVELLAVAVTGAWLWLPQNRSFGHLVTMGIFLVIAIVDVLDRFVFSHITPEQITIVPEVWHDLTVGEAEYIHSDLN